MRKKGRAITSSFRPVLYGTLSVEAKMLFMVLLRALAAVYLAATGKNFGDTLWTIAGDGRGGFVPALCEVFGKPEGWGFFLDFWHALDNTRTQVGSRTPLQTLTLRTKTHKITWRPPRTCSC